MKIAFDLDDTLIPTTTDFAAGSTQLRFPLNFLFKEKLRSDAVLLLRELSLQHEIWIYTTSLRNELYVKLWFRLWGIAIKQVINQDTHRSRTTDTGYACFSKAPKLFGIDILVDDQPGVALECKKQGCSAIIINPEDKFWVNKVKAGIKY